MGQSEREEKREREKRRKANHVKEGRKRDNEEEHVCVCVFRALCLLIVFECLCLRMCLLSCVGRVGELLRFDLCCCDLWCFETHVVDLSVF